MVMPLSEYYDELMRHDWYFEMTDNHAHWQKEHAMRGRLRFDAEQSQEHMRLYKAVQAWKRGYTGEKPERPSE